MQSLRRGGTQNDFLKNQLKNSRSVKEIKRNFSLRNSSQSRPKLKVKSKTKNLRHKSKQMKRGSKSIKKRDFEFLCKGCETQKPKKNFKSKSKTKKSKRLSTGPKGPVSLRKNFSNFQFNKRSDYLSQNRSLKITQQRILRTEKIESNQKTPIRPITWISGSRAKKKKKEVLQTYYTPSIQGKAKLMGLSKKFSTGGIIPYSKRMLKKTAYYNSMHLNVSPDILMKSKSKQDCRRDNGSFLTNSLLKQSSILGPAVRKKSAFGSKRTSKSKNKKTNFVRRKIGNQQSIKSRPILKELVRQLKGNDSLQLEILKTLGCKIKTKNSPKRGSKRPKSKLKSKSSIKPRTKSKIKLSEKKKTNPKKSKLERLKNLNRLISRDKQQVSKIQNEIEKSGIKGAKSHVNLKSKSKSKRKSKRTRVKLTLQPSLLPPTAIIKAKHLGPSTQHGMKSIGFSKKPFSLQNHQIFQCVPEKSKFKGLGNQALDLTSLRLGSKAFNKKRHTNTVYVLPEQRRPIFKSKENIPTKLRTAKKSRRRNFHLQSPMLVRVGSASILKPKMLTPGSRKKSPGKKRVMRDEDIKHHMNIILTNDLNLERRKPKKRKRIFN